LPNPQLKAMDNNVFIHQNSSRDYPLILWSPHPNDICQVQLQTVQQLHELHSEFSPNCKFFDNQAPPIFVDRMAMDFRLHPDFVKNLNTVSLPENIAHALLKKSRYYRTPGAFSSR